MDDSNPYDVMDGQWGGVGPQSWFVFPDIHARNVFEVGEFNLLNRRWTWVRVWDDEQHRWRDITDDESILLEVAAPATNNPQIEAYIRRRLGNSYSAEKTQLLRILTEGAREMEAMGVGLGEEWGRRVSEVQSDLILLPETHAWLVNHADYWQPKERRYAEYVSLLASTYQPATELT